ncbi:hypothetical protein E2C01_040356 [Portunus trituberculatus]|uniref:Uncharacterized protein n=1 Tax=Portunus trituberculatus TaxID=210409 RepID=A0A5B7FJH8_PORTR|nr:hypothetical protein [Portunus trituberculatus]
MGGSEGRLYRTGDLSTDNLTAIGSAANEWAHEDEDSWDPNDPNEESRVSVVKFSDDKDTEDGKEVSCPLLLVLLSSVVPWPHLTPFTVFTCCLICFSGTVTKFFTRIFLFTCTRLSHVFPCPFITTLSHEPSEVRFSHIISISVSCDDFHFCYGDTHYASYGHKFSVTLDLINLSFLKCFLGHFTSTCCLSIFSCISILLQGTEQRG